MSNKYIVSLKDIAEKTGVSISTVSRVIKKKGEISPKTRERVLKVAEELGYHSNLLIDGIKTGKTRTIGVIIPIGDPFFNQIVRGIHDKLTEKDYVPIIVWTNETNNKEHIQIKRLLERRVEGIIIRPIYEEVENDYFKDVIHRGLPLVTVDRELEFADVDFVGTNDYKVGFMAADYLAKCGYNFILHLAGPDYASTATQRRKGFEDYVAAHNSIKCKTIVHDQFRTSEKKLLSALADSGHPTAIFAANDLMAYDVYKIAHKHGYKIPDDLSIIGVGDLEASTHISPPLTTIRQQPLEIGHKAVELIFSTINNKHQNQEKAKIKLNPEIIERKSVRKL